MKIYKTCAFTVKRNQFEMATILILTLLVAFASGLPDGEDCNTVCTKEYNPVCGVNTCNELEMFSNQCNFENAMCEARSGLLKKGALMVNLR